MRRYVIPAALALLILAPGPSARADNLLLARFEQYLESLRQQAGILGLSAAIVSERQIIWERGFGFQDPEAGLRATPDTPYLIGGLTQTFTSTLLLRCAEQGLVGLDDPIRDASGRIPEAGARIRHVLAHASHGTPGEAFRYDEGRYAALTAVVEACTDRGFAASLATEVLEPLGMIDSVPAFDPADPLLVDGFDDARRERYLRVLQRVARPYRVDRRGRASLSPSPTGTLTAATGLVSTVRDIARFDAALHERILLRDDSLAAAWRNAGPAGRPLPTGLGWFVQSYQDQRLVWHFGIFPDAFSSLILKVPDRGLTLILLANGDGLSAPFGLEGGDVTNSLFARLFLRFFL